RVAFSRLRRLGWAAAACLALSAVAPLGLSVREASADSPSRRAWLGVELEKAASGGVIAKRVINNSPAAKAGLSDGDQIVTADGVALDDPKQLIAKVALIGPGNTLPLRIRRGGAERDVTASLVPFPGQEQILRLDKMGTFAPGWKAATAV